jgi:competence protein ComEC
MPPASEGAEPTAPLVPAPLASLAPPRRVPAVGDLTVLGIALGAAAGSVWAVPVPVAVLGLALVPALVPALRSPLLLVPLAVLCTSALAARSLDGLETPRLGQARGWATLVTDPERLGPAVRTDVRLGDRRYEVWWRGGDAGVVDELAVGDRLWVEGRVRAPRTDDLAWFRPRHVAGRLDVVTLGQTASAAPPWSWANTTRATLEAGMRSLSRRDRALALGFLVGDDRDQLPEVIDDFRASGLTHLTAVSGQNVAFALALFAPLLRRQGLVGRFVSTVALLALFGFVTRWEPSVMRAAAMAGLTALGTLAGRPASALRRVALAVTVLLVVDPLLVWSVGFRLSVAATLGIVVLAPGLAARLPGPAVIRQGLAVTLAAQAGVAPALLTFGRIPVASVPANLLAGPAAGLAMLWGLPAGLAAGVTGEPGAAWLHLPTRLLVGWVAGVARVAAAGPLPTLGWFEVAAAGAVVAVLASPTSRRIRCLVSAAAALLVAATIWARPGPAGYRSANGLEAWLGDGVAVVAVDRPSPTAALAHLRRWEIGRIDVLVTRSTSSAATEAVSVIDRRHAIGTILRPGDVEHGQQQLVSAGGSITLVVVASQSGRLDVAVPAPE